MVTTSVNSRSGSQFHLCLIWEVLLLILYLLSPQVSLSSYSTFILEFQLVYDEQPTTKGEELIKSKRKVGGSCPFSNWLNRTGDALVGLSEASFLSVSSFGTIDSGVDNDLSSNNLPVCWRVFNSSPDLYPLDCSNIPSCCNPKTQNVSRQCQMAPGR